MNPRNNGFMRIGAPVRTGYPQQAATPNRYWAGMLGHEPPPALKSWNENNVMLGHEPPPALKSWNEDGVMLGQFAPAAVGVAATVFAVRATALTVGLRIIGIRWGQAIGAAAAMAGIMSVGGLLVAAQTEGPR